MRQLLLCAALLSACAVPVPPPLSAGDLVARDVTYSAEVISGAWSDTSVERGASAAIEEVDPQDRDGGPQLTVECRVVGASEQRLSGWLGDRRPVGAWDAPEGAADALFGAAGVEVLTSPRLVLNAGAPATLSTLGQRAFVAGFEVAGDAEAVIADPVVEVANEGFQLWVTAALGADGVQLDVVAEFVSVQGLDELHEAHLPIGAPVHLQQPVSTVQRVSLQTAVAAGRELLVRLPGERRGEARLLVLRARPVAAASDVARASARGR